MKVLVIGKGGREHALCWRLSQSPSVRELYCTGGNPGIDQLAQPLAIAPTDIAALAEFAAGNTIDLTVVGPEEPLAAGIADEFERRGLRIFGPTRAAAELEASKTFSKTVMRRAGVPTADFESFTDAAAARRYVESRDGSMVVKADGLAFGKGVTVCHDRQSALAAIGASMEANRFGAAGRRVVIEEFLSGEEVSFFALADGNNAAPLGLVQDHKTIFDNDQGPNTGGMGAYSPLPQYDAAFESRVMREVVEPTIAAMGTMGIPYKGVLYAGLMVSGERVNVLEFNVRFGDPECQALMMRYAGDLAEALMAAAEGRIRDAAVRLSPKSAVALVMASGGYPGDYRKRQPINGLERIEGNQPSELKVKWALERIRVKVFQAGTALENGRLVTDGGRVLTVVAMADDLRGAVESAYQAADLIEFEGKHLRRDIARRGLRSLVPAESRPGSIAKQSD
ncbi:MAG TPA: phosphoribosylamine--glycine ligase [Candidatus Binataceae bacterium]|nr:phosphoribosylamine--glycine ligase [Candidatus Binataceae bacterium]